MKEENKHHDLERTKHLVTSAPLLISTKCIAFLLELVAMHLLLVTISRTYAKPRQCDHLSDHTLWEINHGASCIMVPPMSPQTNLPARGSVFMSPSCQAPRSI